MLAGTGFRVHLAQSLVESIEDVYEFYTMMRDCLFVSLKRIAVLDTEWSNRNRGVRAGIISHFLKCEMYWTTKREVGQKLCDLPAQRDDRECAIEGVNLAELRYSLVREI